MSQHKSITRDIVLGDALDLMKTVMQYTNTWLPGQREAMTEAMQIGRRIMRGEGSFGDLDATMRDWMVQSVGHDLHVGADKTMAIDFGFEPTKGELSTLRNMLDIATYPLIASMDVAKTFVEIGEAQDI